MAKTDTKPQLGALKPEQEQCLQTLSTFLIEKLDAKRIVHSMLAKFALFKEDEEKILGPVSARYATTVQNKMLIDTVQKRSPRGFDCFLQALDETQHCNAAEKVRLTLGAHRMTKVPPINKRKEPNKHSEASEDGNNTVTTPKPAEQNTDRGTSSRNLTPNGSDGIFGDLGQSVDCQKEVEQLTVRVDGVEVRVDGVKVRVDDIDSRLVVVEEGAHIKDVTSLKQELEKERATRQKLEKEKTELSQKIKDLEDKNNDLQGKMAGMTAMLQAKSKQLEEARVRIKTLEKKIKDVETENKSLSDLVGQVQKDYKEVKKVLATQRHQHKQEMTKQAAQLKEEMMIQTAQLIQVEMMKQNSQHKEEIKELRQNMDRIMSRDENQTDSGPTGRKANSSKVRPSYPRSEMDEKIKRGNAKMKSKKN